MRKSTIISKRILYTVFLLSLFFASAAQSTVKALFLGNSYTFVNNLPKLIHDVALSAGDTLIYDSHTPGGYQLIDHSNDNTSLNKINSGNWDYVVIQGQSQEPIIQYTNFVKGAMALHSHINQSDPCDVIIPYMTWGRKNGDASNCPNFPVMCTYEGMDSTLRNKYLSLTKQLNGEVSPVSVVWNYIRKNHPSIELYQPDESHPSPAGSYAAACCFYAAIFKKDPTQIIYDFGLPPAEASAIRNAAKSQVFDSLSLWDFKLPPAANIKYTKSGGTNEFNFSSINYQGVVQNYLWDFGDGDTASLQNPVHSYSGNGTYTVELKTYNCNLQGWDTATVDTSVQLCSHTPTIYTSNSWLCNYDTLYTQAADSFQWLCGGTVIPGATKQYLPDYAQYNNSGIFSVIATVSGCSELSEQYFPQPVFSGYYFDLLGDPCNGDTVAFAVLHNSGSLSGFELILWYKNDTLLSQLTSEDTLLITEGGLYEVKVVDTTSKCPHDTTYYSIKYDCNTQSIAKKVTTPFTALYPNPATKQIILKWNNKIGGRKVRIYAIDGRLIKEIALGPDFMHKINIAGLQPGIYFLLLNDSYQTALKFIKK